MSYGARGGSNYGNKHRHGLGSSRFSGRNKKLPERIKKTIRADVVDESKAGPDYESLSKDLGKAGFPLEATVVDAIGKQEGTHKEILKEILKKDT